MFYHKSGTHSDDECYHKKNSKLSSPADSKSTKGETFITDSTVVGCNKCSYNRNVYKKYMEVGDEPVIRRLALGSISRCVIPPYLKKLTVSKSWQVQGRGSISLIQS